MLSFFNSFTRDSSPRGQKEDESSIANLAGEAIESGVGLAMDGLGSIADASGAVLDCLGSAVDVGGAVVDGIGCVGDVAGALLDGLL